jgi:uncharacterized coiled-coil protein SlyX
LEANGVISYDSFMKTATLRLTNSVNRFVFAFILIPLVLACFALAPQARAACHEGCDHTHYNTFLGDGALGNNTAGYSDTATGAFALISNTSGSYNTAAGFFALADNTTGGENTATGAYALQRNTTGFFNTASGNGALLANITGGNNTANGYSALFYNTTGGSNTAEGYQALYNSTIGSNNIALGKAAGTNLTTGSNNIEIGSAGVAAEANTICLGTAGTQQATYIAGISGATVSTGVPVIVDTTGHLGTTTSSARFKEAIQPMDKASEAILALKPVTFRYKRDLDPERVPQFGLVAEDVEKVNPDLVARDEQGKAYTVRYEAVNAMLLNEFLKEHRTVQELKSTAAKQEATIARQQKQIEALTAGLQKVSAKLALSKAEPQTVLNN